MRVALCLLLLVAQLCPAAPAFGAVVQSRAAAVRTVPGSFALPVFVLPQARLSGASLSAPSLSGSLLAPAVPALSAGADRREVRPVGTGGTSNTAGVGLAAPLATLPAVAAPEASAPVSLVEGLAQAGALLAAQPERGGDQAGAVLESLFVGAPRRGGTLAAQTVAESLPEASAGAGAALSPAPRAAAAPSARIVEAKDEAGRRVLLVGVSDLVRGGDEASRSALSLAVAREALSALGEADAGGTRTAALADFLRDLPGFRPEGAVAVSLELDGRNHHRIIFARADGSRRVLLGQFLPEGFVLTGPAEVSADGKFSQPHGGYWREYAGGGSRREWRAASRTEKRGWGPWAYEVGFQDAVLTEQSWSAGAWQDGASRVVKTAESVAKRSWLGRAGDRLFKAPVVGPIIEFCDKAAQTVLTGLALLPRLLGRAVDGAGRGAGLETGGDLAKNPLLRALKGDRWAVERLGPQARAKLEIRVRQVRTEALAAALFPVSPEAALRFVAADIGVEEAAAVLRGHWGVGTFGKRLIRLGVAARGWKRYAFVALGVLTGAVEGAADSLCNPILWAMLGLDAAVAAAAAAVPASAPAWSPAALAGEGAVLLGAGLLFNEGMAVMRGAHTASLLAGLWTLRAAHLTASVLWWGPWLFSATDHMGRIVLLTAEGEFDKDYFKQLSKVGTDAIHYFVIP